MKEKLLYLSIKLVDYEFTKDDKPLLIADSAIINT